MQYKAREIALAWAAKEAAQNVWFKRVLDSQTEFEKMWRNGQGYRTVKVKE